ncbi:MAG TPA: hypothetical protein EYN67_07515 [Flavobacteriales bacterium]|nr:hypothetical protein [Flavobacteriales bacterium]
MKIGTLYQLTTTGETRDLGLVVDNKEEESISMYWTHVTGGEMVKYCRHEFQQILDSGFVTLVEKSLTKLPETAIVYL